MAEVLTESDECDDSAPRQGQRTGSSPRKAPVKRWFSQRRWPPPRRLWVDSAAAALFTIAAVWVTVRGWRDFGLFGAMPKDQMFNEWMLAHDAYASTHLSNPFFTTLQNAPDGVNLLGNVAMQLPGMLLTPVTVLGGARLSYLLLLTFNLAATAFAWYYVLSRHVVSSRLAAALAGGFCGFAPGLIASSNGHPHITAQFFVPFIVWRVTRLREPGRAVRNGLILGGLIIAQFFTGEEILLLTAVGCAVLVFAYAAFRPRQAWREAPTALAGSGMAVGLVLAVTAYPMWIQFFGPQHYRGVPDHYPADLASYLAFGRESLAGGPETAVGLAPNPTEETAFFGWPLLVVALVAAVWLWRDLAVRIAATVAVVVGALSLGPTIVYRGESTGIPGPFTLLDELPVLDSMIVGRFTLVVTAALGVIIAVTADRALALGRAPTSGRAPTRGGWLPVAARVLAVVALFAALVPLAPTPLKQVGRPEVPHFITSGQWKAYVSPGRTLVAVSRDPQAGLRWATVADLGFAIPQGYFLGPKGPDDDTGRWNAPLPPTWNLIARLTTGEEVPIGDTERSQARGDLNFWKADAVVLWEKEPHAVTLRPALDTLLGPGGHVGDVYVYRVTS